MVSLDLIAATVKVGIGMLVLCHMCTIGVGLPPGRAVCVVLTGVRDGVRLPSGRSVCVVSQVCEMVWGCHQAGLCVLCHRCARWCGAAIWPGCMCCVTGVRDGVGLPSGQAVCVMSQVCEMVWGCHLVVPYVLCHRCARWCGAAIWPGCMCCVTGVRDGVGLPSGQAVCVVSQVCEMVWGCHLAGLYVLCHRCARWCGAAIWPGCMCCVTGVRDGVGLPPGRAVCVMSQVCKMVWGCHLSGL